MVKIFSKNILKIIVLMGVIMFLLSFFACTPQSKTFQKEPSFDEVAQLIVEAFEENSVGPIQDILSESALNTKDLNQGIEYGNKLLKNEGGLTINNDGGYEGDGWESGKYYKWRRCFFIVEGDKNSFMLVFHYFLKNDFYPEDKGLYRIYFAPRENYDAEINRYKQDRDESGSSASWNYGATYERAGIYNPKWKVTPPPDGNAVQKY